MIEKSAATAALIIGLTGILMPQNMMAQEEKTWKIDPAHSTIGFSAIFMNVNEVSGKFSEYSASITTEGTDFSGADIRVTVQANSIDTDNDLRDNDLRGENFLFTEEYPEIRFKSQSFKKTSDDMFEMKGLLTIRDVTREESFNVRSRGIVEDGEQLRAGFKVTGTIDRFDYNVDWNRLFGKGFVVSEEVNIRCEVSLLSPQR